MTNLLLVVIVLLLALVWGELRAIRRQEPTLGEWLRRRKKTVKRKL